MPEIIPPVDKEPNNERAAADVDALEKRLLEMETYFRKLGNREASQRYLLKWIAVFMGVIVIVGMAALLTHLMHRVFMGPFMFVRPAFSVAMIVAPIACITTITVALFVGAFRRFEDKDMDHLSNGVQTSVNMMRGG